MDSQPPRTVTGEQPVAVPVPAAAAPAAINMTDKATFVVDIKTIVLVSGVIIAVATGLYATKALADDLKGTKADLSKAKTELTVELGKKADKDDVDDAEKRLREMEKFVAAQVELNKAVAAMEKKRDEDDAKREKENKEAHEKLDSKLNQLLMRK